MIDDIVEVLKERQRVALQEFCDRLLADWAFVGGVDLSGDDSFSGIAGA